VLPPRRAAKDASAAADAFVAAAGLAFSAALACAASRAHDAQAAGSGVIFGGAATTTLMGAGCAGAWICLLGATASDGGDVLALLRGGGGLKARGLRACTPLHRVAAAAKTTVRLTR
jgi:hypothetical protein